MIELNSTGDVVHIVHRESRQSFLRAEYGAILSIVTYNYRTILLPPSDWDIEKHRVIETTPARVWFNVSSAKSNCVNFSKVLAGREL